MRSGARNAGAYCRLHTSSSSKLPIRRLGSVYTDLFFSNSKSCIISERSVFTAFRTCQNGVTSTHTLYLFLPAGFPWSCGPYVCLSFDVSERRHRHGTDLDAIDVGFFRDGAKEKNRERTNLVCLPFPERVQKESRAVRSSARLNCPYSGSPHHRS